MKPYYLILFLITVLLYPAYINAHAQSTNENLTEEQIALLDEYFNRSADLVDQENFEGAISYYDKALEISPNDPDILFDKGLALDTLGKTEEAISYYDKVLTLVPNDTDTLYNKALALDTLGKTEEAISYYDKVLTLVPNDTDTLYNKALALYTLGKTEEAISYYDKVLTLVPNDTDTLYNKALALDTLGKTEEAQLYYNRVLSINPNDTDTLNRLNLNATLTANVNQSKASSPITADSDALNPDQTLLVIVGVFVLILASIIIIELVARSRASKKQILSKTDKDKSDTDKKELQDLDDQWKGI
jgi:tetratricopeptide (TPR) repeat protein